MLAKLPFKSWWRCWWWCGSGAHQWLKMLNRAKKQMSDGHNNDEWWLCERERFDQLFILSPTFDTRLFKRISKPLCSPLFLSPCHMSRQSVEEFYVNEGGSVGHIRSLSPMNHDDCIKIHISWENRLLARSPLLRIWMEVGVLPGVASSVTMSTHTSSWWHFSLVIWLRL